jgi:hypothetical protein
MASSEMLRRVALVRTDVSEELSDCSIRATKIGELGTPLAITSNRRTLRRNNASVARYSWRCPYFTDSCHSGEVLLHSHRRENLKSYIVISSLINILLRFLPLKQIIFRSQF